MADFSCPMCGKISNIAADTQRFRCPECGVEALAVGDSGVVPPGVADGAFIVTEIGRAGELSAEIAKHAAKAIAGTIGSVPADTPIYFSIGGYENDPRELWDIPEVRLFILQFAFFAQEEGVPKARFHKESQDLFDACVARSMGRRVEAVERTKLQ
jgi:hypothetical protein